VIRYRIFQLVLIAVCLSQPVLGQINPFRGSRGTPLNAADLAALTEATNRLLDRPQLVTGGTEAWSNLQSGTGGTVAAGDSVRRKGMACRVVHYQFARSGSRTERRATLTWCRTQDGWKIA
jgi:surface antigen